METWFLLRVVVTIGTCLVAQSFASSCSQGLKHISVNGSRGHTLPDAAKTACNGSLIVLTSSHINLSSRAVFTYLTGVTIKGRGSTITCSKSEAGLVFINTRQLNLTNFTLTNCSTAQLGGSDEVLSGAVHILRATDLTLSNITITKSKGTSLNMVDLAGKISIGWCIFERSSPAEKEANAGGVRIKMSDQRQPVASGEMHSNYSIQYCLFNDNHVTSSDTCNDVHNTPSVHRSTIGGGLNIILNGTATGNSLSLLWCNFTRNSAIFSGAGLNIFVLGKGVTDNNITIRNSIFEDNKCLSCGGGGANVDILNNVQRTTIAFIACVFSGNSARFGGGTAIRLVRSVNSHSNLLKFTGSAWYNNSAAFGSAVDVRPANWNLYQIGGLPRINFDSCLINKNIAVSYSWKVTEASASPESGCTDYYTGAGAMSVNDNIINFTNYMIFTENNGSALILRSSLLTVHAECNLTFRSNKGSHGGAIYLQLSSRIKIEGNASLVRMNFESNTALYNGGAVAVYNTNKEEVDAPQTCFLYCNTLQDTCVNMNFQKNFAGADNQTTTEQNNTNPVKITDGSGYGEILFASSLSSCLNDNFQSNCSYDTDKEIYTINGSGCCLHVVAPKKTPDQYTHRVSTRAKTVELDVDDPAYFIPGKETRLNITAKDDLKQLINTTYRAVITSSSETINLDRQYAHISDSTIKLYGEPEKKGQVRLEVRGVLQLVKYINVRMAHCPPGYVIYTDDKNLTKCICGTHQNDQKRVYYKDIRYCSQEKFVAKLIVGIWAGYINSNKSSANLRFASCPYGYCNTSKDEFLPAEASKKLLEKSICSQNRHGVLCGNCIANNTSYFHSPSFICKTNAYCAWGPVLYIVSELLPITAVFMVTTCLNTDFSKGRVNSFIIFAQIQPMLLFSRANTESLNLTQVEVLYHIYNVIYGFFNLEMFSIDDFAFCLWDGATPLDLLVVKYVSTLFAVLLVTGMVLVIDRCMCCCQCCKRVIIWRRKRGMTNSVVNGIVAFLTLCYSMCAKVTIHILSGSFTRGQLGYTGEILVYFYGELGYFSRGHLPYAIPALFVLFSFVIAPPLLLMAYPVCYQVMFLCHISDTRVGHCLTRWIEKFKPLLDAFQNPFKDKYRFTAGLFFLYRVAVPVTFLVTRTANSFYSTLEVLFIAALAFHCMTQPYQSKTNNILHTLMLANLTIINSLYLYNYTETLKSRNENTVLIISMVLLMLIYLPLMVAVGYLLFRCVQKLKVCFVKKWKNRKSRSHSKADFLRSNQFPARLLDEKELENNAHYQEY